mgnify:FL=1
MINFMHGSNFSFEKLIQEKIFLQIAVEAPEMF